MAMPIASDRQSDKLAHLRAEQVFFLTGRA
jgi:hypothetical protein